MNIQYSWYKKKKECAKLGCEHITCSMATAVYLPFVQYDGTKGRDKRDKLPNFYHKAKRKYANPNILVFPVPVLEVCAEVVIECSAG